MTSLKTPTEQDVLGSIEYAVGTAIDNDWGFSVHYQKFRLLLKDTPEWKAIQEILGWSEKND